MFCQCQTNNDMSIIQLYIGCNTWLTFSSKNYTTLLHLISCLHNLIIVYIISYKFFQCVRSDDFRYKQIDGINIIKSIILLIKLYVDFNIIGDTRYYANVLILFWIHCIVYIPNKYDCKCYLFSVLKSMPLAKKKDLERCKTKKKRNYFHNTVTQILLLTMM